MVTKSDFRSALRMFWIRISAGIAIGLVVFALSARHLDGRNVFKWLGPSVAYADDSDGGGDNDGGDGGGDHDGGDRDGDHGDDADHDSDSRGDRDNEDDHDTDSDDHEKGDDPADRSAEPDAGNGADEARKALRGLEGIRDLTPVSKEEEAGLVGNWGSPAKNDPPGSKP